MHLEIGEHYEGEHGDDGEVSNHWTCWRLPGDYFSSQLLYQTASVIYWSDASYVTLLAINDFFLKEHRLSGDNKLDGTHLQFDLHMLLLFAGFMLVNLLCCCWETGFGRVWISKVLKELSLVTVAKLDPSTGYWLIMITVGNIFSHDSNLAYPSNVCPEEACSGGHCGGDNTRGDAHSDNMIGYAHNIIILC